MTSKIFAVPVPASPSEAGPRDRDQLLVRPAGVDPLPGLVEVTHLGVFERIGHIEQVQAQCRKDLVIARAPEMNTLAGLADAIREPTFQRGMHVLVLKGDIPPAVGVLLLELDETAADVVEVVIRQQCLPI